MKKSIKLKKHADKKPVAPAPATPPADTLSPLYKLALGLCLVGAGLGTWAVFEFVVWNALPAAFVGKWVVVGGPEDGATFDFYRSGAMVGNVNVKGKNAAVFANVRVEDQKIYTTTINPNTNRPDVHVQRILLFTDKLVIEDEKGQRLVMERAN